MNEQLHRTAPDDAQEVHDFGKHGSLVSSRDVDGTAVYSQDSTHIGSIDHLMIDKQTGKVAYAVMGFGGFLGIGEEHYPIPWNALKYDTRLNGFVTHISAQDVKGAPDLPREWYADREWERRTHDHYGVQHYWL